MKKNQVNVTKSKAATLNKGVLLLIKEFGSQKALASELDIDLSLIYRWLHSKLPPARAPQILSLMKKHSINIPLSHFNSEYFGDNNEIKFK